MSQGRPELLLRRRCGHGCVPHLGHPLSGYDQVSKALRSSGLPAGPPRFPCLIIYARLPFQLFSCPARTELLQHFSPAGVSGWSSGAGPKESTLQVSSQVLVHMIPQTVNSKTPTAPPPPSSNLFCAPRVNTMPWRIPWDQPHSGGVFRSTWRALYNRQSDFSCS